MLFTITMNYSIICFLTWHLQIIPDRIVPFHSRAESQLDSALRSHRCLLIRGPDEEWQESRGGRITEPLCHK